ncbi:MAG: DUF5117 domain-containing protein, partial [Flavobacterium sp.]
MIFRSILIWIFVTSVCIIRYDTCKGFSPTHELTVHKVGKKYFLEIDKSILGRDILIISRIDRSSSNIEFMQDGHNLACQALIRFELGPNGKIEFKSISAKAISNDKSENGLYYNVNRLLLSPVIDFFKPIKYGNSKEAYTIDFTTYLLGDNELLYLDNSSRASIDNKAKFLRENSWIKSVVLKENLVFKTGRQYILENNEHIALEMTTTFLVLNSEPYKPRYFDERVGFFTSKFVDYDINPQRIVSKEMIQRWRLEPKTNDVEKYFKGELVEPKKPIVFYI